MPKSQKIKVQICTGTTCFVMGASEIMLLEEELPANLREKVEIEGITCMNECKNAGRGKAPFVKINGEVMSSASTVAVIDRIIELTEQSK
jgi:NADH:ubiquinone oxidoreductase subunit E